MLAKLKYLTMAVSKKEQNKLDPGKIQIY